MNIIIEPEHYNKKSSLHDMDIHVSYSQYAYLSQL